MHPPPPGDNQYWSNDQAEQKTSTTQKSYSHLKPLNICKSKTLGQAALHLFRDVGIKNQFFIQKCGNIITIIGIVIHQPPPPLGCCSVWSLHRNGPHPKDERGNTITITRYWEWARGTTGIYRFTFRYNFIVFLPSFRLSILLLCCAHATVTCVGVDCCIAMLIILSLKIGGPNLRNPFAHFRKSI